MTTQCTPGPWKIRKAFADDDGYEIFPTRGKKPSFGQWAAIATVDGLVSKGESARKNARLIAAAPDLLEALRTARDHIDMGALEISHCKDAERIRAAIAKATGGAV